MDNLKEIFKAFHANPELSYQEYQTTSMIKKRLEEKEIEVLETGLETGLVAMIRGQSSKPVICLRADIDALPIKEETDLTYSSNNEAMHACGHDFHTTALLGAAFLLKEREHELQGTIKLLFQPAEESSHGAESVIASGVLDDVDAIFGLHVAPNLKTGLIGIRKGSMTAAVDRFEYLIEGVGCHGARPHQGVDPIVVSSSLITALQSIHSRNIDPFDPAVISVTRLISGNTWNVIPMSASMEGTVRTLNPDTRKMIEHRMRILGENIAEGFGAKATLSWYPGPPATHNDSEWTDFIKQLAINLKQPVIDVPCSMGGEDFAYYQERIKGVFFNIGVGKGYPLHHPKFIADINALNPAVLFMANIAIEGLNKLKKESVGND